MKIVRILSLACIICLLSACGSDSITGPDATPRPEPPRYQTSGGGMFGSGN
ncbi:MAG TPA: hypothetical protein VF584_11070 [Longimicrobium sp.]|jgi:hypothetical protein